MPEYLEISTDLRTIQIPQGITCIGVEKDDKVKRIWFRVPKQYGEFDLSLFTPRINYTNALGEGDIALPDDKTVEEAFFTFSWLIEGFACKKKGNVSFALCLRLYDENHTPIREFHTQPSTLPVLEGLEVDNDVTEANASILDNVLGRLDDLEEASGPDDATEARIRDLESDVADLLYTPVAISGYQAVPREAEMGMTIDTVTLSWSLNKEPQTLSLDGTALALDATSHVLNGLNLTESNAWTLRATDERNAVSEKRTGITFLNGIYYGVAADPETIDSTLVLSLTRKLTNSVVKSIDVSAGAGEYIWYCLPVRMGERKFKIGGFAGGFEFPVIMDFTNASGYTEPYRIYRSSRPNLGAPEVEVE